MIFNNADLSGTSETDDNLRTPAIEEEEIVIDFDSYKRNKDGP